MEPNAYVSRLSSILVAVVLVTIGIFQGAEPGELIVFTLLLLIPLALIWFPAGFGRLIGSVRGSYMDKPSPGCIVAVAGWILLLPLVAWYID